MTASNISIIDKPGFYPITDAQYHADPVIDPSLSSSLGRTILFKSPRHAKTEHPRLTKQPIKKESGTFDLGSAAHSMLLHDERKFGVHDGDSWRGNVHGIKSADWKARERDAGRIPILQHQLEETKEMVDECRRQLPEAEAKEAFDMELGVAEKTLVWQEKGVWLRCKIDWLPNDRHDHAVFYDYKTTMASAHPDDWQKTGYGMHVDFQSAFYLRGIRKVFGLSSPRLRFVVQERYAPYEICTVELSQAAQAFADRKVDRAIEIWRQCLDQDLWPGYPTRVVQLDPPPWAEAQWLEREEREPMDPDMVRRMVDWQSGD